MDDSQSALNPCIEVRAQSVKIIENSESIYSGKEPSEKFATLPNFTESRSISKLEEKSNYCNKRETFDIIIKRNLIFKLANLYLFYDKSKIHDIMFNKESHVVTIFKDYLHYDDTTKFIRKDYKLVESQTRINNLCSFYESYSKLFDKYILLKESKDM